eukprot:6113028-Prymnesium_polylepis.1
MEPVPPDGSPAAGAVDDDGSGKDGFGWSCGSDGVDVAVLASEAESAAGDCRTAALLGCVAPLGGAVSAVVRCAHAPRSLASVDAAVAVSLA